MTHATHLSVLFLAIALMCLGYGTLVAGNPALIPELSSKLDLNLKEILGSGDREPIVDLARLNVKLHDPAKRPEAEKALAKAAGQFHETDPALVSCMQRTTEAPKPHKAPAVPVAPGCVALDVVPLRLLDVTALLRREIDFTRPIILRVISTVFQVLVSIVTSFVEFLIDLANAIFQTLYLLFTDPLNFFAGFRSEIFPFITGSLLRAIGKVILAIAKPFIVGFLPYPASMIANLLLATTRRASMMPVTELVEESMTPIFGAEASKELSRKIVEQRPEFQDDFENAMESFSAEWQRQAEVNTLTSTIDDALRVV